MYIKDEGVKLEKVKKTECRCRGKPRGGSQV